STASKLSLDTALKPSGIALKPLLNSFMVSSPDCAAGSHLEDLPNTGKSDSPNGSPSRVMPPQSREPPHGRRLVHARSWLIQPSELTGGRPPGSTRAARWAPSTDPVGASRPDEPD